MATPLQTPPLGFALKGAGARILMGIGQGFSLVEPVRVQAAAGDVLGCSVRTCDAVVDGMDKAQLRKKPCQLKVHLASVTYPS